MKTLTRLAVAAAALPTALLVAPVGAVADAVPDARGQATVACDPPSISTTLNGVPHAQIRDCAVTWISSGTSGLEGFTVSFQMRDAATDGFCAQALIEMTYVDGSKKSTSRSECNGVWTTFSWTLTGTVRPSDALITLTFGGHGPVFLTDHNPAVPL
jgi:hypothetical protein